MRRFFSPAVAVMNNLSYGKKFIVLGCLSIIAVLVVIFLLYQNLNRVIQDSYRELDGLQKIKAVTQVAQGLQQHLGASVSPLSGIESMSGKQDNWGQEISRIIVNMENTFPADSSSMRAIQEIKTDWAKFLSETGNQNPEAAFTAHTEFMAKMARLEDVVSDEARLTTDGDLDSHHLLILLTYELPRVMDKISQLRILVVDSLVNKRCTEQQKLDILVLKTDIEQLVEHIDAIIEHTSRYNPALKPVLDSSRLNIRNLTHLIVRAMAPDIVQEKFAMDPAYFAAAAAMAENSVYTHIYENFIPQTAALITLRMTAAEKILWLSICIPGFIFLIIFYFTIGAHLSVRNTIGALAHASKAIAAGNVGQRLPIKSQDEIGQITASFNQMAAGFEDLLAKRERDQMRLNSIISSSLDAVVQMDAQGAILSWTHQAHLLFGWTEIEVQGRLLQEIIFPDRFRERFGQGLLHFLETGEYAVLNKRFEIVGLHRDGHEFTIELALNAYQFADTIEFCAFIRDISLQKRALQTLKNNEQRYRALFESSRDALMILSPTRGYLSGNKAAVELFACKDEQEFLRQNPGSLSPERQFDGRLSAGLAQQKMETALANGSAGFEWLHKRLTGETFFAEVQLSRVEIDHEVLLQATVRDITERKNAKAALVASEARISAVLRTMSDAVVQIDAKGRILLLNDAVSEMFGYAEDELLGFDVSVLMPEPHASRHQEYLKRHFETKERAILGRRVELVGKHKDGGPVPIELSVNELVDDYGSTFIGVIREISDRKAIEQAQEAARLEAEQHAQAKSEFLANMSHEIRTPLNAIIGLAKMNMRDNKAGGLENNVRIHEAGLHLLSVVNDILDFSKIEAGKMTIDPHPFQLAGIVDDAVSLVDLRAKEKNLRLIVEKAGDLPEWVIGDSLRLRQILVNLLSNAIKFTEHGEIRLDIRMQENRIDIAVTDTGIGMSPEQQSRLFAAFEQVDSSTTRKFGGTGLGLAISRNLARIMGGDISVSGALGVGSRFLLSLPLPATSPGFIPPAIPANLGPRLSGLRVLAAEDVAVNRLVLEDMLIHEGAHAIFADNGQQALDLLEEHGCSEFDVVLMDIQMPVMDGYHATRLMREIAPDLPVIGLTAHAMAEERRRCLDAGMREHITKPIEADALVTAVLRQISRKLPEQVESSADQSAVTAGDSEFPTAAAEPPDLTGGQGLIDWPALLQRFEGRRDFIDKLIANALDGVQQANVQKLRDAADLRDHADIKFIAHSLKGMAGVFESQALLELARQAELAAKNQEAQAALLAMQLAEALADFLAELKQYQSCRD